MSTSIEIRWSTDPACVGYANNAQQRDAALRALASKTPDYKGNVERALKYVGHVQYSVGIGTYVAFDIRANGQKVSLNELRNMRSFFDGT